MNRDDRNVTTRLCHTACCMRAFGDLACFLSLLCGICLFVVCLMAIYTHGEVTKGFGMSIYYGLYAVLFSSLCTICTALFGICGMSAKNRFFLTLLVVGSTLLIFILLIGLVFVLAFPYSSVEAVRTVMVRTLKEKYGTFAIATTAWDYLQSYLLCCAVDDNGWNVWKESNWFLDENSLLLDNSQTIPATNPAFIMVPKSCCYRKIDYLTRQLTNEYTNLGQCQNWQYGPPKFRDGAHNTALYYRGCLSTIKAYIKRYSFWITIFGSTTLFFLLLSLATACIALCRN